MLKNQILLEAAVLATPPAHQSRDNAVISG